VFQPAELGRDRLAFPGTSIITDTAARNRCLRRRQLPSRSSSASTPEPQARRFGGIDLALLGNE
jgi:hypothetical protein